MAAWQEGDKSFGEGTSPLPLTKASNHSTYPKVSRFSTPSRIRHSLRVSEPPL
jgi:hypothetical protein